MTITDFAKRHGLRVERFKSDDGDGYECRVVNGRIGESNIYEHTVDDSFGVMFITDGKKAPRTGLWKKFEASCLAAGMTRHQTGDAEGVFLFDPKNTDQSKVAIRGIKARAKRRLSPEQAAAGAARLQAARLSKNLGSKPHVEAIS
jgi:hypothetical protein